MSKAIVFFCDKWLAVLSNSDFKDSDFIGNESFYYDCKELGFDMDCGESFIEKYGRDCFRKSGVFSEKIEIIDDIVVLGSAIFSQWRYYSHWAMSPFEGSEINEWVILAFTRLKSLAEEVAI